MVISTAGIVAAEHPLAAQAGAVVLARGGHAVDAAIAANAVMGVVAPMMNGIGGDLFAMVYDAATDAVHGLNASGWSAAGASIEQLAAPRLRRDAAARHPCRDRPGRGGGLDGAARAVRCRAARRRVLAAGDRARRAGLSGVGDHGARMARQRAAAARRPAGERARYLPYGQAPQAGEVFRNPDLARSLRAIATRRWRRLLPRRDRRPHPRRLRAPPRHAGCRGPGRVPRRVGRRR